jgi:hypothetical protein
VHSIPHFRRLAMQLGLLAVVPVLSWSQGTSACDFVAPYGTVDAADVQAIINMTIGITTPCTVNIGGQGVCNAAVVQRVINAALGGTCVTGYGAVAHYATLTWTASASTGISGYNVYRAITPTGSSCPLPADPTASGAAASSGASLYVKVNSALVVGITYIDTGVAAGVSYCYATTAVNSAGVESAASNQYQTVAVSTP